MRGDGFAAHRRMPKTEHGASSSGRSIPPQIIMSTVEYQMANLQLSVAVGNYDRCRPLFDGEVQIDGVAPVFMKLSPEEIFFRAFRNAEFDICELSLSSSTLKISDNNFPYVCIPVFLSRMFRHSAVYVRKDRIKTPQDLKSRKVGLPEYQLTANVWVRAFLNDDFGVAPEDIIWVRGGIAEADRTEKITLDLPKNIRLENAPRGKTISALLAGGEIDGFVAPRVPAIAREDFKNIGWLFDDPQAAAIEYYRKSNIFPIMHVVGVRRELVESHAWLPNAVFKAFSASKDLAISRLEEMSASKITMPFVDEKAAAGQEVDGAGFLALRHRKEQACA
jgi:4,5-dihydroxyphthalate decarboxylase